MLKRTWSANAPSPYVGQPSTTTGNDAAWVHMPSHPYASAYSALPNPFNPTAQQEFDTGGFTGPPEKKPRISQTDNGEGSSQGRDGESDGDEDDDDDDDEDGDDGGKGTGGRGKGKGGKGDGKAKVKLTRGSRACIACRKIKMRCIPDESAGSKAPCKRCKSGGHECIFEESNRGKRSTRKNEALAAKVQRMEAALKGIGAALGNLDQHSLNSFSTALHSITNDPDVVNVITSHTLPSAVPTLAVSMNRLPFNAPSESFSVQSYDAQEDYPHDAHQLQPPLSPRLHSLPDNVLSPLGLLAEASLQNDDTSRKHHLGQFGKQAHRPSPLSLDSSRMMMQGGINGMAAVKSRTATSDVRGTEDEHRGVASQNYFRPGVGGQATSNPADEKVPELMTMVSREEIDDLFEIFFDRMAPHVPLIYREFHTPDLVLQRSQFLCTVVCALAARYYTKRTDLHPELSAYAKRLAFEVPSRGYKSVEVCQAYLLLSMWTLGPEKTFEQDRTWLMLGMAIRMATDLNLHRKSTSSGLDTEEGRARDLEIMNRERCWLHCFVLDRSLSSQMGKPYTLREDYITRNAYRGLSAYVVLQQMMSRAIDSIYSSTTTVSGLRQDCDYMLIVRSAHEELRRWLNDASNAIWNKPDPLAGAQKQQEYDSRAQFYFAYHSLVLYSFGLENAIERAKMDISFFLTNVYEAATRVCTVVKDEFSPKGYLTYLPDTNFVMCSYALLSLLKLLKPELRQYHDSEEAIFKLVSEMADILEDAAADPSHQPAIYAAFIREIVRKTRDDRANSPAPMNALVDGDAQTVGSGPIYDPQLMDQTATWQPGDLLPTPDGTQFAFVPQGGDMMILPSAAGPSESLQNSPTNSFIPNFGSTGTPQTASAWAEYLPTFMSADDFDGWDGSMLLPGFGRGQITLSGGLLHSTVGSTPGLISPAQHTPSQSRSQSRVGSRATSPVQH